MPEPSWTVKGAGSPEANGDYEESGLAGGAPAFLKVGGGMWLFWYDPQSRYHIYPDKDTLTLYYSQTAGLPANPWTTLLGQDPAPIISAYQPPPVPPQAINLLTEGRPDPADTRDPTPTLSWTYVPGDGGDQDAYQIQVASSHALLDAYTPDVWDSAIVESPDPEAIYTGEALADYEIYFWAVRVRDQNGAWSEDW